MKVREVMTSDVSCCQSTASLAEAAVIMWQRDCGVVPIVNERKQVVGVITDRDICMALATKDQAATKVMVGEVIYGKVAVCQPDDEAEDALKIMKERQVRRLPVTSEDGVLLGVLSIGDFLRHAGKGKNKVSRKKLLLALREISIFRPLHLHQLSEETIKESVPENRNQVQKKAGKADKLGGGREMPAAANGEQSDACEN